MPLNPDVAPNLPQSLDHPSSCLVCHLSSLFGHSSSLSLTFSHLFHLSSLSLFLSLITRSTPLTSQPSSIPFFFFPFSFPFHSLFPHPLPFPLSPPPSFLSLLFSLTFSKVRCIITGLNSYCSLCNFKWHRTIPSSGGLPAP